MTTIEAARLPVAATRRIPWRRLLEIAPVAAACLGELLGAAAVIYGVILALDGSQAMTAIEICTLGGAVLMITIAVIPAFLGLVNPRRLC